MLVIWLLMRHHWQSQSLAIGDAQQDARRIYFFYTLIRRPFNVRNMRKM